MKKLLLIFFLIISLSSLFVIASQVRWRSVGKLTWLHVGFKPLSYASFESVFYDGNLVYLQTSESSLELSIESSGHLVIQPGNANDKYFNFLLPECKDKLRHGMYHYDVRKERFVDNKTYWATRRESSIPSYDPLFLNFLTLAASGWMRDSFKKQNAQFAQQVKSLP